MLNKGVLFLLTIALALLASPGLGLPAVASPDTLVVDDDGTPCLQTPIVFSTIEAAVEAANSGDTIRVCEGDYWESGIAVYTDYVTITGPGATPEDDGVATVHLSLAGLFTITADYVTLQGLVLDATSPTPSVATFGVAVAGASNVSINDNEVHSATLHAVVAYPDGSGSRPRFVQVLNNNIHDSADGVKLGIYGHPCDDCTVAGNRVSVTGLWAIIVEGNNSNITNNVVAGGSVSGGGDPVTVAENEISGPVSADYPLLFASAAGGNRVSVTGNRLNDSTGVGIEVEVRPGGGFLTIQQNTFARIAMPILLDDVGLYPLAATVGGSQGHANRFVDSGGSLVDNNYLLYAAGVTTDIDATYNDWGLCTAAEVAQEVASSGSVVDFEPFIEPDSCSATPTPGPTATPTPGGTRTVTIPPGSWANFAWSGDSSPQAVADCFGAGNVAVMYRLDAATGSFQRWVRGRDDLSNMGDVLRYDALLALNAGAQPATCAMPDELSPYSLTMPAGRWANFPWLSNVASPAGEVADTCGTGNLAVMYRLDTATQTFRRWVRGRDDLSNMTDVQPYDALLALNGSAEAAACTFPVIIV